MASLISMSVYDITFSPAIFENRHGLTSSASNVPLLTSVSFNLTSDELPWLVGVSFVFLDIDWIIFLVKSEKPQTDFCPCSKRLYTWDNNSMQKETSLRSFGLPRFAHQYSLTLGLRCGRINILSLTRVFFRTAT